MIMMKLAGGLGNQMFQYALGRQLSVSNDSALKLDASSFKDDRHGRRYRLDHFQIKGGIATLEDKVRLNLVRRKSVRAIVRRGLDPFLPVHLRRYVKEASPEFEPRVLRIRGSAYLDGCWEIWRYFESIAETIRADFQLKTPLSVGALGLLEEIRRGETVSIHVRRQDFVSESQTRKYHGVLSPDYYARAIAHMRERLAAPEFLVFSDDPEWCQKEFASIPNLRVPPLCGKLQDYEDLFLMSQCQHHIIANSTFSWWSAWLGQNPARCVLAPRNFTAAFSNQRRHDLYPAGWQHLAND